MGYEIVFLPKEVWKGTTVPIEYTTEMYFDVEIGESEQEFSIKIEKKKFEKPVTHTPEEYDFPDRLYQDHWEGAKAWGIVSEEDGRRKLLACIETCPEEWSNRLIVTELWVEKKLRRQGVGRQLMAIAKKQARHEGRRAMILETQSCNVDAIAFYRSQGFVLVGLDSCCYSNRDVQRREVRFNLGYFMDSQSTEETKR